MAKHQRASKKKLAPSLVLALSVASVASPLAVLFNSRTAPNADAPVAFIPPIADQSRATSGAVLAKSKRVAPTYTAIQEPTSRPQMRSSTATRQTVETPTTTTSPTTERQRAVQRAPSATEAVKRVPAVPPSTPKPQILRQTTTTKPPPPPTTKKTTTQATKTTTQTTQEKTPDPPKAPSPPSPPAPTHQLLAQIAQKYVNRGIPYRMGGNSLSGGMDCSHFVWMVLKEAGYNVQYRDSGGLAAWTQRIASPQPGDLVLFRGHVGIYVSPGKMVDQGSSGGAHLRDYKYYDNFIGFGRLPI
jgi:cell wall-associated NlpC family hydrolase